VDRLIPWLRRSGWAYLLLAVALAALAWRIAGRTPAPTQPDAARPAVVTPREPTEFLVHVAGAVRKPGVYRIAGDGRVIQAIRLAGGPAPTADLGLVNLAAPLQDGQQVLVPRRATTAAAGAPVATAGTAAAGPLSLSSATAEQLDTLDGIGPTLAARIVAWRGQHGGFSSVDQLLDVPGIGETRLEALRGKVTP
jgi:competence protein ComEA